MKTDKNINEKIDSIFSDNIKKSLNQEDFDFEERVINSDIVQLIRKLMKSGGRNWNQEDLADELDVSAAYISKLFSGDKKVNVNLIARLERVFDTRIRIVTNDMVVKTYTDGHEVHQPGDDTNQGEYSYNCFLNYVESIDREVPPIPEMTDEEIREWAKLNTIDAFTPNSQASAYYDVSLNAKICGAEFYRTWLRTQPNGNNKMREVLTDLVKLLDFEGIDHSDLPNLHHTMLEAKKLIESSLNNNSK